MLMMKSLGWFGVFVLYNFALATFYGGDYSELLPSLVHYFYIFSLLVLMIYMRFNRVDFDRAFIRFLRGFYVFLLINLAVELVTGPYYPNLFDDPTDERSVRAFFWNQNDLAVVLCIVGWLVLTLDEFKGVTRLTVVVITLAILYFNDSKAALLSFLFFSIPVYFIFRFCSIRRIAPSVWYVCIGAVVALFVAVLISISDVDINFSNDTYTFDDLLFRPIFNIVTLQPSGEEWGSINNRTDAAIFVAIEYLRTYGFGLGVGGSWLVLTLPQYHLGGAQSPHNALLQFIVDMGYPILIGYGVLVVWAVRRLFRYRLNEYARLKVMAILSFPMLGLSQSGAIVTNYFFWGAIIFIAMLGSGFFAVRPSFARAS
ncbi:MAG: hypothetical protein RLY71_1057 [Pseudomonadota bacterium]